MADVLRPNIWRVFLACLSMQFSQGATAQSPITIDQLLAKPATWQLSSSIDYRSATTVSTLAASVLERQSSGSLGLRYGLNSRFELNARLQTQQFSQGSAERRVVGKSHRLTVGANWLLRRESAMPAVLLEARASLASSGSGGRRSFPGGLIAVTTYKSVDPLVLSLSASMGFERNYRLDAVDISPGSNWRIEPGVNFAVNPRVTLFGGAAFERRNATAVGSELFVGPSERLGIHGGMALSLAKEHSVFMSVDLGTDRSGGMRVQWFYEF